jgi:hypothetical protein
LTNVLGLDEGTAALLVRAERLQEKGQLRQALKYYEVVLLACPECPEAVVNSMPASQETSWRKKKRTPQPNLSMIPERNERCPNTPTITEMDVDWNVREDVRFDYYTYGS